ncbi:uncharacterized protein LOC131006010 [Salvia miltiorrhiza]|uniref:uncharacterized protein LOC131006010 n=1 Tax=Salvia miltiorrhiza TaxID=226208 RepID=UPI0025ACEF87|nr:uncharacterized protein LOC131006010 [Salvia miltiorrhiza]
MDRANKQVGSSSSSPPPSFAVDLFGPKDSSSNSPNSTAGYFGSIFGPQTSMVPGRDPSPKDYAYAYGNAKQETATDYKNVKGNPVKKGVNSSYDENGRSIEPCYYNSSIYYGGQEIYSPTSQNNPPQNFKKDGGNAEQNESNSSCAPRGNWWQGSLYY